MLVRNGPANVDHREQHENVGLQKTNEEVQANKNDRDDDLRQRYECQINLLTGEHVRKETNGERKGAREVADDLDGQHEKREPPERSEKLLDVPGAMCPNTGVVIEKKRANGKAEGDHGVHGRRIKAGDQADQVQAQNEYKYGAEEDQIAGAIVPDHFFRRGVYEIVEHFHGVLRFAGAVD